uniref:Uncharacterized protein n=1 Tax=Hyaloperonospora arabidopsidis (strain Emoy2) TaxID=559515 RepID=M4B3N8_HYAAE
MLRQSLFAARQARTKIPCYPFRYMSLSRPSELDLFSPSDEHKAPAGRCLGGFVKAKGLSGAFTGPWKSPVPELLVWYRRILGMGATLAAGFCARGAPRRDDPGPSCLSLLGALDAVCEQRGSQRVGRAV